MEELTEPLNKDVPVEVTLRYVLQENGKLKAYIDELEEELLKRNEVRPLKQKIVKLEERISKLGNKKSDYWQFINFLAMKYNFKIENERRDYFKN